MKLWNFIILVIAKFIQQSWITLNYDSVDKQNLKSELYSALTSAIELTFTSQRWRPDKTSYLTYASTIGNICHKTMAMKFQLPYGFWTICKLKQVEDDFLAYLYYLQKSISTFAKVFFFFFLMAYSYFTWTFSYGFYLFVFLTIAVHTSAKIIKT